MGNFEYLNKMMVNSIIYFDQLHLSSYFLTRDIGITRFRYTYILNKKTPSNRRFKAQSLSVRGWLWFVPLHVH